MARTAMITTDKKVLHGALVTKCEARFLDHVKRCTDFEAKPTAVIDYDKVAKLSGMTTQQAVRAYFDLWVGLGVRSKLRGYVPPECTEQDLGVPEEALHNCEGCRAGKEQS